MEEEFNPNKNIELRREQIREKMKDPKFLPTRVELIKACEDEATHRYSDNEFSELVSFGGMYQNQYEILTQEFVESLSKYFSERIKKYYSDKPITLLEIGAGKGRLSHFIQEELNKSIQGKFNIIATDSGKSKFQPDFPVTIKDAKESLKEYNPDIVFASFIPNMGTYDWTEDIENTESVKEYIVVGPHQPATHGQFIMEHLPDVEKTQICLHDGELNKDKPSESQTTARVRYKEDVKLMLE